MQLKTTETIDTDVLVIGGGAAGIRAAIEARKHNLDVVLLSESPVGFKNNTAIAAGGFAASGVHPDTGDSPEAHFKDIISAGRFINDRRMVETMTNGAAQQVHDLMKFGVDFVKIEGELILRQQPGHSYPRHVDVVEFKGHKITRPMRRYAAGMGVKFIEGITVTRLLRAGGRVVGALGIDGDGRVLVIDAKATILATGGIGHLYLRTNNAVGMTGDGYALAYEVGATFRDMEFVQFYPTTYGKRGSKMCIYERLMRHGATLWNSLGEDILKRHGMEFASATRDIMSRTIMREVVGGRGIEGKVVCDLTTIPEDKTQEMYRIGLVRKGEYPEKIQVAPAVHFFIGGVKINENCQTGIDGLYAAGEVCGGMHGANRLAGNAITETLVFGTIAGEIAAAAASEIGRIPPMPGEVTAERERLTGLASGDGGINLDELQQSLQQTMWDKVGVIRSRTGLEDANREIVDLREKLKIVSLTDSGQLPKLIKLANMFTVAEMVGKAALARTESRGSHYRADYPEEDNEQWMKTIEIYPRNGEMQLKFVPVN